MNNHVNKPMTAPPHPLILKPTSEKMIREMTTINMLIGDIRLIPSILIRLLISTDHQQEY